MAVSSRQDTIRTDWVSRIYSAVLSRVGHDAPTGGASEVA